MVTRKVLANEAQALHLPGQLHRKDSPAITWPEPALDEI